VSAPEIEPPGRAKAEDGKRETLGGRFLLTV
jgi:hypothetical protein